MSCQYTVSSGQNEFDFFQQLMAEQDNLAGCCGPIANIGFTGYAMNNLRAAIRSAGFDPVYLKDHQAGVDENAYLVLVMCARHWIAHASTVGMQGVELNNEAWRQLGLYTFSLVCTINGWDHKEVTNYLKTYHKARKSKNDE